jgi:hypothetical protein
MRRASALRICLLVGVAYVAGLVLLERDEAWFVM